MSSSVSASEKTLAGKMVGSCDRMKGKSGGGAQGRGGEWARDKILGGRLFEACERMCVCEERGAGMGLTAWREDGGILQEDGGWGKGRGGKQAGVNTLAAE